MDSAPAGSPPKAPRVSAEAFMALRDSADPEEWRQLLELAARSAKLHATICAWKATAVEVSRKVQAQTEANEALAQQNAMLRQNLSGLGVPLPMSAQPSIRLENLNSKLEFFNKTMQVYFDSEMPDVPDLVRAVLEVANSKDIMPRAASRFKQPGAGLDVTGVHAQCVLPMQAPPKANLAEFELAPSKTSHILSAVTGETMAFHKAESTPPNCGQRMATRNYMFPMEFHSMPPTPMAGAGHATDLFKAETVLKQHVSAVGKSQRKDNVQRHELRTGSPSSVSSWESLHHADCYAGSAAAGVPGAQQQEAHSPGRGGLGARRPLRSLATGVTTLVVRNIPARYTQEMLLKEWIPDGSFDLMHRPYNYREQKIAAYAFINFVSHESAVEFQHKWHGQFLARHGRNRALDVTTGTIQGYLPYLRHLVKNQESNLLPIIFRGTTRMDTKAELDRLMQEQQQR